MKNTKLTLKIEFDKDPTAEPVHTTEIQALMELLHVAKSTARDILSTAPHIDLDAELVVIGPDGKKETWDSPARKRKP